MSKYRVAFTSKFKKQYKQILSRGFDAAELDAVVTMLSHGESLPERYRDHALQGTRKGHRDCHIRPDWILIYRIEEDVLTLLLCETGTHSDLFR
ncbi:MAG: type II toxin-antitoxin system YafQ family toxin [Propionibacteriaceae bacterium]|jgi:mRNA interferase YafQ|nr:type II toxin-antitoxin system YafQ family toxin [Propionibacteriaceae bacterium]